MQKLKIVFLFSLIFSVTTSFAQEDPVILEYINTYKDIAISEMQRTGIPAAIKLAQGIHETDAGTSDLVKKSNNHFGLKCKTEWTGMSVSHTDDAPNECFRKYVSSADSYKDQSDYLKKTSRYAFLFDFEPTDYKDWAYGLKRAGYATNPKYPQILIKLIEDYKLQDFTLIALGKTKPAEEILVKQEEKTSEVNAVRKSEPQKIIAFIKPEVKPISNIQASGITTQPLPVAIKNEKKTEELPAYPEGEFKINETRVIYAKTGTSYLSIAEKYSLPLARIFEFNEINEKEFVDKDQLIYIMRKRKTGINDQHIVKAGESLSDIAQIESLRIESLLEYNNLKAGMKPEVGMVLYLKTKAPAIPETVSGK